jgi:hypothetical protein
LPISKQPSLLTTPSLNAYLFTLSQFQQHSELLIKETVHGLWHYGKTGLLKGQVGDTYNRYNKDHNRGALSVTETQGSNTNPGLRLCVAFLEEDFLEEDFLNET